MKYEFKLIIHHSYLPCPPAPPLPRSPTPLLSHSPSPNMLVLITYDIPDQKRRIKLATFLEGYGRRVQKSVFECFMGLDEMRKLYDQLQKRVKLPEDDVRLYWLNRDAVPRTLTLGSLPPTEPPKAYII